MGITCSYHLQNLELMIEINTYCHRDLCKSTPNCIYSSEEIYLCLILASLSSPLHLREIVQTNKQNNAQCNTLHVNAFGETY